MYLILLLLITYFLKLVIIQPCGSMVERLTTNQEAAGSRPAKDAFLN